MKDIVISDAVKYIGADDKDLDLFESQYIVPNGVSYNSYVILDEKIAVMDTIDTRKTDEWKENLETVLDGRTPDYLVVSHLEPDHAGSIKEFADKKETSETLKGVGVVLQGYNSAEKYELVKELIAPHLNGMFVTPKDIDESVKRLSFTISEGLNIALIDHNIFA